MKTNPTLSVIICTYNPDPERLSLTLRALERQTLPKHEYEVIIVDNASTHISITPVETIDIRIVQEMKQGLTFARGRGSAESAGEIIVFVDDDNVLEEHYLEITAKLFSDESKLGAVGGIITASWNGYTPPQWIDDVADLLAVRNKGMQPIRALATQPLTYPGWAPVGAGMAVRRKALDGWNRAVRAGNGIADRTGASLSSGGDNDIVLHILREGWMIGYEPSLMLEHLIPKSRTSVEYLSSLAEAIMISWIGILDKHGIRPWKRVPKYGILPRLARAYFRFQPWRSPIANINWHRARGQIIGRSRLS